MSPEARSVTPYLRSIYRYAAVTLTTVYLAACGGSIVQGPQLPTATITTGSSQAFPPAPPTVELTPNKQIISNLVFSNSIEFPAFPDFEKRISDGITNIRLLPAELVASSGLAFTTEGAFVEVASSGIVQNSKGEYFIYTAAHVIRTAREQGAKEITIFIQNIGATKIPLSVWKDLLNITTGEKPDGVSYIKLTPNHSQFINNAGIPIPQILPPELKSKLDQVNFANTGNTEIYGGRITTVYEDGSFNITGPETFSCESLSGTGIVTIIDGKGYLVGTILGALATQYPASRPQSTNCSSVAVGTFFTEQDFK